MVYENQDDKAYQADDLILNFTIENVESPDDLNYARWGLAQNRHSDDILIEKTSNNGTGIEIDTTDNIISVILLASETKGLNSGSYYFELECKDVGSMRSLVATGDLEIRESMLK
jgi:hypothetical protein